MAGPMLEAERPGPVSVETERPQHLPPVEHGRRIEARAQPELELLGREGAGLGRRLGVEGVEGEGDQRGVVAARPPVGGELFIGNPVGEGQPEHPTAPLRLATPKPPAVGDRVNQPLARQILRTLEHGVEPPERFVAARVERAFEPLLQLEVFRLERVGLRRREGPARDHVVEGLAEQGGGRPRVVGPRGHGLAQLVVPALGVHPGGGRPPQAHVVGRPQRRAIPAPGPRHVPLLPEPHRLELGQHVERLEGLDHLPPSGVGRRDEVQRVGPLRPAAIQLHRLAIRLDPAAGLRDALRPGNVLVETVGGPLELRIQRLEPPRRLGVEHIGVALIGDPQGPERLRVERVADIGEAHQLDVPPHHRCGDHGQEDRRRGSPAPPVPE